MPNITGKGIWGAKADGTWCAPSSVWGVKTDGTYCDASYVWGVDANGNYVLLWGKNPVAPATATATWVAPTSVRVNWTPPAVNTNTHWIVRRGDGSIVATVPVGTLTTTDATPLLQTSTAGAKTLAAYTVEGYDGSSSSARVSTNTVAWNLDAATTSVAVTYPTATTATVTVSWTPNATYGEPDAWRVWRADGTLYAEVAASARSYAVTSQPRGTVQNFRVLPYVDPVGGGTRVQGGNDTNTPANIKAVTPVSLSLTALSSPLSTLRLTWASGGGTVTAYEVEFSTNGSTWVASSDDTSPSDYGTTVAGYMRVRATSPGGPSDWAQAGPVTPINDTTAPAAATGLSVKPESSYGRMVGRWTDSTSTDTTQVTCYYRVGTSGNWLTAWGPGGWTGGARGPVTLVTGATAGQTVQMMVRSRDAAGNYSDSAVASYTLVATPKIIDANNSGTWRVDEWRNDGVAGPTDVMHGRTSSGENIGCFFYGEALQDFVSTHTVVSATVDYNRDGSSQGMSAAIQPQVNLHTHPTKPSTAPTITQTGAVLGSGVARSGTTGGSASLSATQIGLLAGSYKGIALYRPTSDSSGGTGSYYMALFPYQTNSGGKIAGRVTLNHLG